MRIWQLRVAGTILLLLVELVSSEICRCAGPCANNICSCSNNTGSYEISCSTCWSRSRLTASEGVIFSHNWEDFTNNSGYNNLTSCSVLIESPVGTTIRLYLDYFKTECSWDFLHFHDGFSAFDTTIGIYGGLLLDGEFKLLKQDSELVSTSNQLYIVFRPDEYVNHDGFSISYRVDGCPKDCSGHGQCAGGVCQCDARWHGDWCDVETCKCENGGTCDSESERCVCVKGYSGENCQIDTVSNWWSYLTSHSSSPGGRSGFGGALVGNTYWVFGGYRTDGTTNRVKMAKYDILTNTWSKETDSGPSDRDGHTLTAYKNYLFMFGGQVSYQITDDLWKYNITTSQWHQLNPQNQRISSMGHCAVLINSTIYFIGGIDANGVSIIDIQTYDIEQNVWNIVGHRQMTRHFYNAQSKFLNFKDVRRYHGRYGPSCVHNPVTDRITVFGGLNTTSIMNDEYSKLNESDIIRESTFAEYDTYLQHWSNLWVADKNTVPMVYLAAVGLLGKSLVILGGRHLTVGEDRCYNTDPYIVNLESGEGREVKSFGKLKHIGPFRMGHSSFVYNNSVYFFGGYNGKLHDDFIVYNFGKCEDHTDRSRCVSEEREDFNECSWDEGTSACFTEPISECGRLKCYEQCVAGDGFDRRCVPCQRRKGCTWDQNYPDTCRPAHLVDSTGFIDNYRCRDVPNAKPSRIECREYRECEHCKDECVWKDNTCNVNYELEHEETDCKAVSKPCTTYATCDKCLQLNLQCMWCQLDKLSPDGSRAGQCLDTSTYYARYPYGQCVKWSMARSRSTCPVADCSGHGNCTLCQSQPECGWCDDASGTGTGTCHSGTYHGPLDSNVCPANTWFYDTCPLCQCNGHSNCTDNVYCDQCQGNTKGAHCDTCVDGFYGDATNNGVCKPCDCSRHSEPYCNNLSGRCTCNTDGVAGIRCDTCLSGSLYTGDPTKWPYGTCFRTLTAYTKFYPIDVKTRKVNFMMKLDIEVTDDVTVKITSSNNSEQFYLNTTIFYTDGSSLVNFRQAGPQPSWHDTFKRSKFDWDKREAELRLFLEFPGHERGDSHTIQVEVSQATTQIDLKQFFIIFFSCIIILLLVFLLAWTAKIRYSQYRNQRNQEIQLLERSLRPFKTHKVLFKDHITPTPGRIFEVRPLGIEPLSEEKYGIVSYLLTMPGPKDVNIAIVSGSFVSSLSYGKVISNPNINFEA